MPGALHPKVSYWIRRGIFDDLPSFEAFEARVNEIPEEKDRGDIFEIFVEGYLATQTIMQSVKHWVVGNIPLSLRERYKLPSDPTGIDGIYETHDGNQVAYQVKYRRRQQLTFAEVAPFLGITEQFSDRVIFTNAATLSEKAVVRTRWVSGEVFRALSPEALGSIEAWIKTRPPPIVRAKPDPSYQVQALADIKAAFAKHDRATVVMACGTGKTLVALWAAEQETPKTVLVLVPSLLLLQQTLREWSDHTNWGSSFSYLCVCSDPTVGLKDDAINIDKSEVGFRIDTDPAIVRQFLERQTTNIKVVFSTYQSSPVVGAGALGLPPFDIAIFDEAHKTTGFAGTAFGWGISDQNIRIKKRLFLTATPRHIDIRHRDKEGEFRIYSMNDESVYGPRAHTLSFATAAQKGIICPYKVIISLIDKEMVDDFTRKHGITIVKKNEIAIRWVANLIATKRAIESVDALKIITFHSRVKLAKEFASNEPIGIATHLKGYDVRHVNGMQSSADRGDIMRTFAAEPKAIVTNARCLTEGVNIPAVDMVAFVDPRHSLIDIAQAVGRAMRKPRGPTQKKIGYVVVPLFAGTGRNDSIERAVESEKFDVVADVVNALQEHDEELVDIIREMKERKGAGKPFNPRRFIDKVKVIGPRIDLNRLARSIGIEICDRIGSSWDEWFGLLMRFKAREGHCRVPQAHIESNFLLGHWVRHQRDRKEMMSAERRQRLNEIGFDWNPFSTQWEEGFVALVKFKNREKNCLVPASHKEGNFTLGQWVTNQRVRKDKISSKRKQRLDDIGFEWDPISAQWEEGFAALLKFKNREKNCRVSRSHKEGGFKLGNWVGGQRSHANTLPPERRRRLDEIGFEWDPHSAQWEEGFAALVKFKNREKNCLVPASHKEGNFTLGQWVTNQRTIRNTMPPERRRRLDDIGFEWDARSEKWEEGFAALLKFKNREKNCRVPQRHVEGTIKLGQWVGIQRATRDTMSPERKQRLDDIGFDWDPFSTQWEEGFALLLKFKNREKNCLVPYSHKEGNFKLGVWVTNQRVRRDKISSKHRQRLDDIGFEWDPISAQWEEGFALLLKFKNREKNCLVPASHKEGGVKLGQWVVAQRSTKDTMLPERRKRLNEVGFIWDVIETRWEEGFAALLKFKNREKNCLVPASHKEGGVKLGQWVVAQRSTKDTMLPERRKRLNEIGFIWDVIETRWEEGFAALTAFKAREGDCRVPARHVESSFKLGQWVSVQRSNRDTMAAERIQRLDAIGFDWDPFESAWEKGFEHLQAFRKKYGDCRVAAKYKSPDGYPLGQWVNVQRTVQEGMSAERKVRLRALEFIWDARVSTKDSTFKRQEPSEREHLT